MMTSLHQIFLMYDRKSSQDLLGLVSMHLLLVPCSSVFENAFWILRDVERSNHKIEHPDCIIKKKLVYVKLVYDHEYLLTGDNAS